MTLVLFSMDENWWEVDENWWEVDENWWRWRSDDTREPARVCCCLNFAHHVKNLGEGLTNWMCSCV
jgi:hypothetical protein